jgi:hypothetical protein
VVGEVVVAGVAGAARAAAGAAGEKVCHFVARRGHAPLFFVRFVLCRLPSSLSATYESMLILDTSPAFSPLQTRGRVEMAKGAPRRRPGLQSR